MIVGMAELSQRLAQLQARREMEFKWVITPALAARMNDAALVEALITGLPMAQGIQHRILRSRGRGAVLMAKVRYRQGVRMVDHLRGAAALLTAEESAALEIARVIADEAVCLGDEETRFRHVYDWVCHNITYVHTAPGQKGYERLVGAASVLKDKQANCQGFADVLYLLCGLCGIVCEYRCGRGEIRLHVWNAVRLDGVWREVDTSKGARERSLSQPTSG